MMKLRLHITEWHMLLLGSVSLLCSCVSEVESEYIPAPDAKVETTLLLSAHSSFSSEKEGRMSSGVTQQVVGDFRDLQQVKLFAFTSPDINDKDETTVRQFTPITLTKNANGPFFDHALSANKEQATATTDIPFYIGTNRCIGYGIVNRNFGEMTDGVTQNDRFAQGLTLTSWNQLKKDPGNGNFDVDAERFKDFYFGPKSIYPGNNLGSTSNATLLLNWLNGLLKVTDQSNHTWKQVIDEMTDAVPEDAIILKTLYEELTESVTGSYENVKSLLESVYNQLLTVESAESKKYFSIRNALTNRILHPVDPKTSTSTGQLAFEAVQGTGGYYTLNLTSPADYTFPSNEGLPDGAVILGFDPVNEVFFFNNTGKDAPNQGVDPTQLFGGLPVQLYAYPSEMIYRVDSPIKSSSTLADVDFTNKTSWADVVKNYTENGIQPTTKSAVLEQPFTYLVGCLATRAYIKGTAGQGEQAGRVLLPDNAKRDILVPEAGYPLTGILVGMQRFVGWNGKVIQTPPSLPDLQYIYYDRSLRKKEGTPPEGTPTVKPLAAAADPNSLPVLSYTLVLESASATAAELSDPDFGDEKGQQTKQLVVLELKNTGEPFRGHSSMLITTGMTFYLVGELNLKNQTIDVNDPQKRYSIFEQGKRTFATLKITSLAGAYNCIPDLRNPSLSIDLKTDWNWQNGIIYDDDIRLP